MQSAHYHLLFNHLPIIIPAVGLAVLILGFVSRSEVVKRTACFVFILGALGTLPAFFTGEDAEHAVKGLAGVTRQMIHEHEEVAETFAILSYLLGALALITLWASWKRKSFSSIVSYVLIGGSLVVLFFAQQTGNSGGEIRHTEIRKNQPVDSTMTPEQTDGDKDDD